MNNKIITALIGVFFGAGLATGASADTLVYSNDFENPLDVSDWVGATPNTNSSNGFVSTQYLGDYTETGSTTLTLTGLQAHTGIILEFDLYLFGSWDGNNTTYGLDYFSLSGDLNGAWTFTNHQSAGQSYDGTPDEIYGTAQLATHVYRELGLTGLDDGFTISHSASTFTVTFGGPTSQSDEQWGIDNVKVYLTGETSAVPEPGTITLISLGLVGLVGASRKNRKK